MYQNEAKSDPLDTFAKAWAENEEGDNIDRYERQVTRNADFLSYQYPNEAPADILNNLKRYQMDYGVQALGMNENDDFSDDAIDQRIGQHINNQVVFRDQRNVVLGMAHGNFQGEETANITEHLDSLDLKPEQREELANS